MHAHHDDADADADPADDVQFAVEHLVNSRRTALPSREKKIINLNTLKTASGEDDTTPKQQQQQQQKVGWVRQACYRGDEDLQPLLFRADVSGRVNHRPCWPAAVQLQPESQISHNIRSRDKDVDLWLPNTCGSCDK